MRRITTHVAVAVAALTAGAAGSAVLLANADPVGTAATVTSPGPPPPEQVRTVVVTRTIHRVRHVHVRARRPAPVSAPPIRAAAPVAVAPRTVRSAPVSQPLRTSTQTRAVRPTGNSPLRTRTSGHSGAGTHEDGAEHEHEDAGGDD